MKNTLYWTALLVGIFVIYLIYKWNHTRLEGFATTTSTTNTPTATTNATTPSATTSTTASTASTSTTTSSAPSGYNEMASVTTNFVNTFPQYNALNNKVYMYLSSFSKVTSRKASPTDTTFLPSFEADKLLWRNMMNKDDVAILKENTILLPKVLDTAGAEGFPTRGVTLQGPASEKFALPSNFELPTCTVAFYMKWKSLNFKDYSEITLVQMFAESPDHFSWKLKKKDSMSAIMEVILGNEGVSYTWTIPISTIVSNGNYTLYTLTFNRSTKEIRVYIGTTGKYRKTLTASPSVKLANSLMTINPEKMMDSLLRAFVFYKGVALDDNDISRLNEYFIKESGGLNKVLSAATLQIQEAKDQRKYVEQQLQESQQSIEDINNQLKQCLLSKPASKTTLLGFQKVGSYPKWSINMVKGVADQNLPVGTLKQCNALDVKNFGDAKTTSPFEKQVLPSLVSSKSQPVDSSKVASKKPFSNIDIVYPTKIPKTTTTKPTTSTPSSSSTSSTATPSSSSGPIKVNVEPAVQTTTTPTTPAITTATTSSTSSSPSLWQNLKNVFV